MSQFSLRVKVVDRKEQEVANFSEKFDDKTTVGDFIKNMQKEAKSTSKYF